MRNFNWETLPKHSVIGKHNIWTADKTDGEYELDTDHMEALFSNKKDQQQVKALNRQSLRGQPAGASGGEMVNVLSSKRSMNIGIFLKQFKRPVKSMIEEIKSGSSRSFGSEKLRELCKLLPDEGEVKQLVSFKGDPSTLPEADLFMLMLVKIPSYEERLSSLVLKEEFFPLMDEIKDFIRTLTAAGKELLQSDHLHSVIRLVLKTGNYMNAGGYAGSAVGFRMASLLKLVDTKSNQPEINLMHYVVMQAQKVDVSLLNFPEQLKNIKAAARINKGDVEVEFGKQARKIEGAKADTLKQEDLKTQMEDFLKVADVCLAEIETNIQELQSVSDSVAEYFCEDPTKFKLEECCSIFSCFCDKFMRAIQENKEREMAELKRRQRDSLQSAAKRRSIATCSSRDQEMEGIALESALQNVLTNNFSRRRSGRPTGSPTSGSPNSGSLSEITSQANLPIRHRLRGGSFRTKEMGRKEWNSAAELRVNSSLNKDQSNGDEGRKTVIPNEEEMTPASKEDSRKFTNLAKVTPNIPSSVKSSSTTANREEDLQDNNEAEAQKLREASKKVLRFQNSRGSSVSSAEYSLENQKSPGVGTNLPRQRTFDEGTDTCLGDPANDDLVRLLFSPQSSSKRNLGRRHSVSTTKVPKTEEEEDNMWAQPPLRTPKSVTREKASLPSEGCQDNPSKQMFDVSHSLKNPAAQQQSSTPAETKSMLNVSSTHPSDEVQHPQGKSAEPTGSQSQSNNENIPPKNNNSWSKAEPSGLFFSFFKRLSDISKLQSSKDTSHKSTNSAV